MFVEHLVKSLRRTLFGRSLDKVPTAFIRLIKAADSDWKDQHFCNKKPKNSRYAKNVSANVRMKHAVMLPRFGSVELEQA